MKVLMINGSPNEHGCTYTALREIANTLEKHGIESEILYLGKQPVSGCIACCACWQAGKCVIDDGVNALAERLDAFDGVIIGSPVYYAGPSGQLSSFLDRLFFSAGKKLAGKPGAAPAKK